MKVLETILIVLGISGLVPVIVFFCVKFGTYAFYSGRKAYEDQYGKKAKKG